MWKYAKVQMYKCVNRQMLCFHRLEVSFAVALITHHSLLTAFIQLKYIGTIGTIARHIGPFTFHLCEFYVPYVLCGKLLF